MKKVICFILIIGVLFVLGSCSKKLNENETVIDKNGTLKNEQKDLIEDIPTLLTYHNFKSSYSFDIPKRWKDKYVVEEKERDEFNYTTFYYKASNGKRQEFFTISVTTKENYERLLEKDNSLSNDKVTENEKYVFFIVTPLDMIPFLEDKDVEEYMNIDIDYPTILSRFHLDK